MRLVQLQDWVEDSKVRVEGWEWLRGWNLDGLEPNAGHAAVAALNRQGKLLLCVTQNTDGLQEMAGLPRDKLVECHGSRKHINCLRRSQDRWLAFSKHDKSAFASRTSPAGQLFDGGCDYWCPTSELLARVDAGEVGLWHLEPPLQRRCAAPATAGAPVHPPPRSGAVATTDDAGSGLACLLRRRGRQTRRARHVVGC